MNDPRPPPRPSTRSTARAAGRCRGGGGGDLDALAGGVSRFRDRGPSPDDERRRITPGRVLKWLALAVAGWLALSLALFLVSAQLQDGVSDDAEKALSSEGSLLTGSTILVLGSDARAGESIDESQAGRRAPTRSCSSTPPSAASASSRSRATRSPRSPDTAAQKINAAYALGGPALMIETVEDFMGNGVEINHLIEVDFEDFPEAHRRARRRSP